MNQIYTHFRERKGIAITGLFIAFLLPMLLTAILIGLSHIINLEIFKAEFGPQIAYTIANFAVLILVVALLRKLGIQLKNVGFNFRITSKDIFLALGFFVAGVFLFLLLDYIFAQLGMSMKIMEYHITGFSDVVILLIYAMIAAPLCEETFFRVYGITCLQGLTNRTWLAVLVSLIGFGLIHLPSFGLRGFIEIGLIWGILPSTLYLWKKNIYLCFMMHSLNNLFFYIIVPLYIPRLSLAS